MHTRAFRPLTSIARPVNILIADSQALFRDGLRGLLAELGDVNVMDAGHYDEVGELAAGKASFDLVLLDLALPGLGKFSGLRRLLDLLPDTPIVIVTASDSRNDVVRAIEIGARGYVPKSTPAPIMLSALRLVLSGGVYMPASMFRRSAAAGREARPRGLSEPGEGQPALTPRQREILSRIAEGKSNKEIAQLLGIAEGTVKVHVTAILKQLDVRNRTEAALVTVQNDQEPADTAPS